MASAAFSDAGARASANNIQCPHCHKSHVPRQGHLKDGVYKAECSHCQTTFTFRSTNLPKSDISFTVNGKTCTVGSEQASSRLNGYLRDTLHLLGTKYMCYEGGCGCCVVAATFYDHVFQKKRTMAVNSCLQPLYACNGWEIETTEGIGSRAKGFHAIQDKIADMNGSQCGYCTPGMVMNMYSLLKENPKVTQQEIEDAFDGNICRCTGYRNILNAMQTFASDAPGRVADIEDLNTKQKLCQKTGAACSGSCRQLCGNTLDPIEVKLQETQWNTPTTLKDLYALLAGATGKKVRLVVGNTGMGVFKSDGGYNIYIDVKEIAELSQHKLTPSKTLQVGANTSLNNLIQLFQESSSSPGFSHLTKIADHISHVANTPVRNVGCWAGNIRLKMDHPDFISDIFILLEAARATIQVADTQGAVTSYTPCDLLEVSMDQKVILGMTLPASTQQDYFLSFKVRPRKQNAHAYVSAAFWVTMDAANNYYVQSKPSIVYAGIRDDFAHAYQTESFLYHKQLTDPAVLHATFDMLTAELNPSEDPVLPSAAYRKQQAMALFYKFVLHSCGDKVADRLKSGGQTIIRPISSGKEDFSTDKTKWPVQKPMPKVSAKLQASGEAEYTDNIPDYPGQLFAEFVLSTEGNATIDKIDATDALKQPGVVRVLTYKDIPGINSPDTPYDPNLHQELLCSGQVLYAGQAVALVLAESKGAARGAARAVKVSYKDVKKPILTTKEAIAAKSFFDKPGDDLVVGNAENAISKSAHVINGTMSLGTQYHFSMETQCCQCIPTDVGFDVHASTQWPDGVHQAVAQVLDISNTGVVVSTKRLGGAYGCKISRNHHISAACALGAKLTDRPVRMHMTLASNMSMIGGRNPVMAEYQVGTDASGKLNGIKITYYDNPGSNPAESDVLYLYVWGDNTYKCDNWHMIPVNVKTNLPPSTSCRGPGSVQAVCIMESIMEQVAEVLGMDPLELKTLNLYNKGDTTPNGESLTYCSIRELVPQLETSADVTQRKADVEAFNKANRWRKRGIGLVPMKYSVSWLGVQYNVQVSIYNGDGTVAIAHGGIEVGQGINTKVIQVCAYELGIPIEMVKVLPTTTTWNANSGFTGSSITSEVCCKGVIECCTKLKQRISGVRQRLGDSASWKDIVAKCFSEGIDISERYWMYPTPATDPGYRSYGVTCAEVELDVLTGESQINRVDILQDCGTSINPDIDIGQVQGAFVMGLGNLFSEQIRYHPDTGINLSNTTWEYKPPCSQDIPVDFRIQLLKNAPNPMGVLGSKAVGEPPQLMSCAALFALKQAITSARLEVGNKEHFLTATPATVDHVFMYCLPDIMKYVLQ